jgi:CBS domain-containing protein
MRVADLMHKDPVTVLPETTLADAARIMLAHHLSGLPVVTQAGELTGIVTDGDMLRRAELGTAGTHANWLKMFLLPSAAADDYIKTHGRRVDEVMTESPITVTPQTSLEEVASLMTKRHIKRLPVLENHRLVGMLSRTDLLGKLALKLIEVERHHPSDEDISNHIKAALAAESWAPRTGIHIEVKDSVVDLEGIVMSDADRRAVNVIAENAPGVLEVHDKLVYVDPGSGMAFG